MVGKAGDDGHTKKGPEMNLEQIYSICSLIAFAGWGALLFAPVARDRMVMAARAAALILCIVYLTQYFTITEGVEGGGFSTLAGVTALFSKAGNVMLGWTHYLAFDLFIGSWQIEDAGKRGVPHWVMIPCLFLTLMLGPIGLLLYFVIREAKSRFFSA